MTGFCVWGVKHPPDQANATHYFEDADVIPRMISSLENDGDVILHSDFRP